MAVCGQFCWLAPVFTLNTRFGFLSNNITYRHGWKVLVLPTVTDKVGTDLSNNRTISNDFVWLPTPLARTPTPVALVVAALKGYLPCYVCIYVGERSNCREESGTRYQHTAQQWTMINTHGELSISDRGFDTTLWDVRTDSEDGSCYDDTEQAPMDWMIVSPSAILRLSNYHRTSTVADRMGWFQFQILVPL